MNEKVIRHKKICDGLNALYARKNHDYGDSFHQTFVEEGLAMARIRLGDKFSRFKTLSRISPTDSTQQLVTDESIRDTLLDLANYAIMTVLDILVALAGMLLDSRTLKNKLYALLLIGCTLPVIFLEGDATATVFVGTFAVPMFFAKENWIY